MNNWKRLRISHQATNLVMFLGQGICPLLSFPPPGIWQFKCCRPRGFAKKQIPAGVSSFRYFIKIAGKTPVLWDYFFFFKHKEKQWNVYKYTSIALARLKQNKIKIWHRFSMFNLNCILIEWTNDPRTIGAAAINRSMCPMESKTVKFCTESIFSMILSYVFNLHSLKKFINTPSLLSQIVAWKIAIINCFSITRMHNSKKNKVQRKQKSITQTKKRVSDHEWARQACTDS